MKARRVRGLPGKELGAMSRDVRSGIGGRVRLVDRRFCWILRWWPLEVAMEGGRCFMMSCSVSPDQEVK